MSVAIRLVSDIINEEESAKALDEDIDPDEDPGEPDIAQSLDSIRTMSSMSNFSWALVTLKIKFEKKNECIQYLGKSEPKSNFS